MPPALQQALCQFVIVIFLFTCNRGRKYDHIFGTYDRRSSIFPRYLEEKGYCLLASQVTFCLHFFRFNVINDVSGSGFGLQTWSGPPVNYTGFRRTEIGLGKANVF